MSRFLNFSYRIGSRGAHFVNLFFDSVALCVCVCVCVQMLLYKITTDRLGSMLDTYSMAMSVCLAPDPEEEPPIAPHMNSHHPEPDEHPGR